MALKRHSGQEAIADILACQFPSATATLHEALVEMDCTTPNPFMHNRRWLLAIVLAVLSIPAVLWLERSSWLETPPLGPLFEARGKPVNTPAFTLSPSDRAQVLLKLLGENRQEIRFWQERLLTISLSCIAGLLAIVTFTLKTNRLPLSFRFVAAGACIALCGFYLLFVRFAGGAISVNDRDLVGIQYGLHLSTPGAYLGGDQVIYKPFDEAWPPPPHFHLPLLARFNLLLTIGSLFLLIFFPVQQKDEETHDE